MTLNLEHGQMLFVRDPSKVENLTATGDQFDLNGANRANRLRLQAIMRGVSLNGTNLKMFQTLGGAETATGLGPNYSSYNNTLGLALTARINSGDSTALKVGASSDSNITAKSCIELECMENHSYRGK